MSSKKRLSHLVAAIACLVAFDAEAGDLTADCDGWEDTGTWESDCPGTATATATLERWDDATMSWVAVETSIDSAPLAPFGPIEVSGSWSTTLEGTYRVSLDFAAAVMCGEIGETWLFTAEFGPFDCGMEEPPPPPPSCNDARTPGYWKNHPESWPVTELEVGGQTYSQECLLDVFGLPTRGDVRIKLIHHLVAAKLNLLPNSNPGVGGTDPSIQPTIDAADQLLIDTGTTIDCANVALTGAAPQGALRDDANALKDALDAYNNNEGRDPDECDDDSDSDSDADTDSDTDSDTDTDSDSEDDPDDVDSESDTDGDSEGGDDIGSDGAALSAGDAGGCSAVGGASALPMIIVPLLVFAARRRRRCG